MLARKYKPGELVYSYAGGAKYLDMIYYAKTIGYFAITTRIDEGCVEFFISKSDLNGGTPLIEL